MADDFDDIFDEEADDIDIERKEWEKLCSARKKEGFRDGVSSGQESMLQTGFNDGFRQNTLPFHNLARIRGCLCGLIGSDQTSETPNFQPSLVAELEIFLERLSDMEKSWLEACGKPVTETQLTPKPQHSKLGPNTSDSSDGSTVTPRQEDTSADTLCHIDTRTKELDTLKKEIEKTLEEYNMSCMFLHVL